MRPPAVLLNSYFTIIIINCLISLLVIFSDSRNRCISNRLVISVLVMSTVVALLNDFFFRSLLYALVILGIFFVLWLANVLGGGDIKLIAAYSVGVEPQFTVFMICFIGLLGGLQITVMYVWGGLQKKPAFERGIPYGIPIVLSGLFFSTLTLLTA